MVSLQLRHRPGEIAQRHDLDVGRQRDELREDLVFQAEPMASERDPYRRLSRLFQLVGRRTA